MIISIVLLSVCLILYVIGFYFLKRNEWVLNLRLKIIDLDLELYRKLPSYNIMLYKYFWIWDGQWFIDNIKEVQS